MLRWLLLFLLLGNALLFFWYAQSHRFADDGRRPDLRAEALRTPSELGANEVLEARPRECALYAPLQSEFEAQRLVELLERYGIQADQERRPPIRSGWTLELPLPADANARVRILDQLALLGWVPESRQGALVLGSYEVREAVETVRDSLPDPLKERAQIREVRAPSSDYQVRLSYLEGYEISSEIKQLISNGWPGTNFQKNPCERVASTGGDQ